MPSMRERWVWLGISVGLYCLSVGVAQAKIPSLPEPQKSSMQNPFAPSTQLQAKNNRRSSLPSQRKSKTNSNNKLLAQMAKTKTSTQASLGVKKADGLALRDQAFWSMKQELFPLDTHQIHELRNKFNQQERARTAYHGRVPPKPISSSIVVDMSPGGSSPVIRLSAGFVTSLVFVDSTGAPWPIRAYDIGDPKAFNVQWEKPTSAPESIAPGTTMSHVMLIQAMSMYKEGNMAVMLLGMNTPIMITLLPGQREVDYRVDLRVPGQGPMALPSLSDDSSIAGIKQKYEGNLLKVLNRMAPDDAKVAQVEGGPAEAWLKDDLLYIRTAMTLISPSWLSKMSSSDGTTHVYVLPATSVLLALDHGRTFHLSVKGV